MARRVLKKLREQQLERLVLRKAVLPGYKLLFVYILSSLNLVFEIHLDIVLSFQ